MLIKELKVRPSKKIPNHSFVLIRFLLLISCFLFSTDFLFAQKFWKTANDPLERGIYFYKKGQLAQAEKLLSRVYISSENRKSKEISAYYLTLSRTQLDSLNALIWFERFVNEFPESEFSDGFLLEAAQRFKTTERHNGAIYYYDKLIGFTEDDGLKSRAQFWKAESYISKGDTTKGIAVFLELAETFPESEWAPQALYSRGRLYLAQLDYNNATSAFELLREKYPLDPITRTIGTALGESYYQQKKYVEAVDALKAIISGLDKEQRAKAAYLIAESQNVLGELKDATNYYLQFINLAKGISDVRIAHYGLGWVYHKQRIYHWAAESFGKAAVGSDELARKALYYKAVNEKLGSRYDLALKTFNEFGKRFKTGLWVEKAYYEWAITTYEYGNYVTTINLSLELLQNNPNLEDSGKILTLLGESYFANGEYTRAIQVFDEADKTSGIPDSTKIQARFQKAWVLYQNNAYEQAQPLFEQLYKNYPKTRFGAEGLFWSADCHFTLEDFGPAGAQFEKFVAIYPSHKFVGAAYYSLGWSRFKMREYADAAEAFKSFKTKYKAPPIALFPYDTDTKLRLGDAYYALGDYEDAIAEYEEALGANPGGDYAVFQIANSFYRMEMSYEAVTNFRKLLRQYPYSPLREQSQYNVAYIFFLLGNYDQAVTEFNSLIKRYPFSPWAARSQYNIGDAHYNAGEYDKAINAYQLVLAKFPRSEYVIEAVNGIQYSQIASGRSDSSSVVLKEFLANNPRSSTADRLRFRQAEGLLQAGDYQGAINAYKDYIRVTNIKRMLPEAWFNLADAYTQIGQKEQAIEAFNEIVSEYQGSDKYESALVSKAQLELSLNLVSDAKTSFKNLELVKGDLLTEALNGLGNIYLDENKVDTAKMYYDRSLKVSQRNDAAKLGLAKITFKEGKIDDAIKVFKEVADKNIAGVGAEAQYMYGRALQALQSYEQAIQQYLRTKTLFEAYDEWVSQSLLGAAECYILVGQRGEARALLQEIIEKYEGYAAETRAQQMLKN